MRNLEFKITNADKLFSASLRKTGPSAGSGCEVMLSNGSVEFGIYETEVADLIKFLELAMAEIEKGKVMRPVF